MAEEKPFLSAKGSTQDLCTLRINTEARIQCGLGDDMGPCLRHPVVTAWVLADSTQTRLGRALSERNPTTHGQPDSILPTRDYQRPPSSRSGQISQNGKDTVLIVNQSCFRVPGHRRSVLDKSVYCEVGRHGAFSTTNRSGKRHSLRIATVENANEHLEPPKETHKNG